MNNMLRISLLDAGTNCQRDGATATLTLRSGAQITGKLERPKAQQNQDNGTVHVKQGDGWATVLEDEIAAVEVFR